MEQVSGPGDGSRDSWQVSHCWWSGLVLEVLVLDVLDIVSVVLEEY